MTHNELVLSIHSERWSRSLEAQCCFTDTKQVNDRDLVQARALPSLATALLQCLLFRGASDRYWRTVRLSRHLLGQAVSLSSTQVSRGRGFRAPPDGPELRAWVSTVLPPH